MFDVKAESRYEAGALLVSRLVAARLPEATGVVSWWTIEAQDKAHDRNDNDAGVVVFTPRPAIRTVLLAVAGTTLPVVDGEIDGMLEFLHLGDTVDYAVTTLPYSGSGRLGEPVRRHRGKPG